MKDLRELFEWPPLSLQDSCGVRWEQILMGCGRGATSSHKGDCPFFFRIAVLYNSDSFGIDNCSAERHLRASEILLRALHAIRRVISLD